MARRFGLRPVLYATVILAVSLPVARGIATTGHQKAQPVKQVAVKTPPRKAETAPVRRISARAGKPVASRGAAFLTRPVNPQMVNGHMQVPLCGEASTCMVPLNQLLARKQIGKPRDVQIVVNKSKRLLRLVVNGQTVKSYVVGLSKHPTDPKISIGDKATPIGDYYVCQKNPYSRFYLALKISYPNAGDADRGLKQGLIDAGTCNAIKSAINARQAPPMSTRLGGNICIHGGGAGQVNKSRGIPVEQVRDWTAGCIALDNVQMKELFDFIPVGTKVHITP